MEPADIEFVAEDSIIEIIPSFNSDAMSFIVGDFGPFRGGFPCNVPLWLGVELKKQHKCTVISPDWMTVDVLEELLQEEKQSKNFIKMPSDHYMIEAKLLLSWAADDVNRCDEVRTLVKDLWDIRMSKLRSFANSLMKEGTFRAVLTNLTMLELNSVRPLLPHSLDQVHRIRIVTDTDRELQSQSSESDIFSFSNSWLEL